MKKVVITHAKRTPIGKFLGAFTNTTAVDLAVTAVKGVLAESKLDPKLMNEVIFGNARQAGNRPNPARQIGYFSGIPQETPAFTVNKACGSGLKAIILAYQSIALGDADIIIAGGTENMTRVPFMLEKERLGYKLGNAKLLDGMYHDGLLCPLCNLIMGETAENLVTKYNISREEQDKYALSSQHKCEYARKHDRFKEEIVPVILKEKGKEIPFYTDENPRDALTLESLAKLEPVFKKGGTVHPGNACGIADSAAALLIMSEEKAGKLGFKPMAYITNYATAGVDPAYMGIAPVPAIKKLEQKINQKLQDFDLIELNEAFAAQVIADDRELHLDMSKVNVNGGAIALGHPIGSTGARIVVTLLHEMLKRNAKNGLATLCMSGGMGMAVSFSTNG
ncbi:MAG: acetyl-CoA C-acetyltransferase, partial [Planctomycetota bacterium]|nr:acetyl-CoA C-acetyltransferase [Planctomycetota bacterium]